MSLDFLRFRRHFDLSSKTGEVHPTAAPPRSRDARVESGDDSPDPHRVLYREPADETGARCLVARVIDPRDLHRTIDKL